MCNDVRIWLNDMQFDFVIITMKRENNEEELIFGRTKIIMFLHRKYVVL